MTDETLLALIEAIEANPDQKDAILDWAAVPGNLKSIGANEAEAFAEAEMPDRDSVLLAYMQALEDAQDGDELAAAVAEELHDLLVNGVESFADRSHLVKKEITRKDGVKTTVWVNPERGAAKEAAKKARDTKQEAGKRALEIATKVTVAARGDGDPPTPDELRELSGHLQHLTRDKLVNVKNMLMESFGKDATRKQQMADSLRAKISARLENNLSTDVDKPQATSDTNSGGEKGPKPERQMVINPSFLAEGQNAVNELVLSDRAGGAETGRAVVVSEDYDGRQRYKVAHFFQINGKLATRPDQWTRPAFTVAEAVAEAAKKTGKVYTAQS